MMGEWDLLEALGDLVAAAEPVASVGLLLLLVVGLAVLGERLVGGADDVHPPRWD